MKMKGRKLSIKKLFQKKGEEVMSYRPEVIHLYTDKNGNKWYGYEDLMEMGILRKLQIDEIQAYADGNMTPDAMKIFVKNARESLAAADYDHVRKLLAALELRMEFIASKAVYVNLCAAIYLLEGEDIIELDRAMYTKKQRLMEEDIDMQDFFLRDLFRRYRGFTEDYETRLMDYFQTINQEDLMTSLMLKKISEKMKKKQQKKKNTESTQANKP